jgi:hypothetical protein
MKEGHRKGSADHLSMFRDHAMRRFRFHLGTLAILVLLIGIGFAALRESNEIWDNSIFSVTLGVLSISILLAFHRTEKRRAFWLGFALFGSAYLGLSLVPSIESRLITTELLTFFASKISTPSSVGLSYPDLDYDGKIDLIVANDTVGLFNSLVGTSPKGSSGATGHFVRIGHSLLTLIAAILGGLLSRYLHTKKPSTSGSCLPEDPVAASAGSDHSLKLMSDNVSVISVADHGR